MALPLLSRISSGASGASRPSDFFARPEELCALAAASNFRACSSIQTVCLESAGSSGTPFSHSSLARTRSP